ncbi:hypothetical protein K3495_g4453 [Podosphaera aphanis]|nr:hypothetical protein K3495_g4453 [Podosphaera aphanis]
MSEEQRDQSHQNDETSLWASLSPAQCEALYSRFAAEFSRRLPQFQVPEQSSSAQPPLNTTQTTTFFKENSLSVINSPKKANKWPTWDGSITTFRSFLVRL